jgi:hypothetical protein
VQTWTKNKNKTNSPLGELGALLPLNDDRRLDGPAGGGGNIALLFVLLPLAPPPPTAIIDAGVPGPANGVSGSAKSRSPPCARSLSIDALRKVRGRGHSCVVLALVPALAPVVLVLVPVSAFVFSIEFAPVRRDGATYP